MTDPTRPRYDESTEATARADADSTGQPVADPELAALVAEDNAETTQPAGTVVSTSVTPPPAPVVAPPPVEPAPAPVVSAPVVPAPVMAAPVMAAPVVAERRRSGLATLTRIVAFLFGVLQALLILRIVLLLLNANQDDQIVSGVMSLTQPFIDPFLGMFNLDKVSSGSGSVLDIAAIVALIAWTLVEALILSALRLFDNRSR